MNWEKICDQVIEYSFYALFFLIPLIMTPWNFELFEYNKMMLVYVLTIIITASWLIKMVLAKKIIFKRTFLDIPLIIFFVSQLISTVFSIDRHTSLWGYYSRFHGGLFSTISYLLLYYAFVSFAGIRINPNKNNPNQSEYSEKKLGLFPFRKNSDASRQFAVNCLGALLLSAILVSIYGVLEHFGIDAKYWVQDVQNRVFSTLGQPNWLAAWLVALIPIPMAMLLSETQNARRKTKENVSRISYLVLLALFYLTLLYTKSRSALLALAPSYLIFWGLVFWI
jgi:putative inorganic carbon (HCO3(-)) transporter